MAPAVDEDDAMPNDWPACSGDPSPLPEFKGRIVVSGLALKAIKAALLAATLWGSRLF